MKVTQVRFNSSNLQFYVQIDSDSSYLWLAISHADAQWILGQAGVQKAENGIGKIDAHNIYWQIKP